MTDATASTTEHVPQASRPHDVATCDVCGKPVTDAAAYEAAADRYNAVTSSYAQRLAHLRARMDALHAEYDAVTHHLSKHEVSPGIGPKF